MSAKSGHSGVSSATPRALRELSCPSVQATDALTSASPTQLMTRESAWTSGHFELLLRVCNWKVICRVLPEQCYEEDSPLGVFADGRRRFDSYYSCVEFDPAADAWVVQQETAEGGKGAEAVVSFNACSCERCAEISRYFDCRCCCWH